MTRQQALATLQRIGCCGVRNRYYRPTINILRNKTYLLERNELLKFDFLAEHAKLVDRPALTELVLHVVALLQQAVYESVVCERATRRVQFQNMHRLRPNRLLIIYEGMIPFNPRKINHEVTLVLCRKAMNQRRTQSGEYTYKKVYSQRTYLNGWIPLVVVPHNRLRYDAILNLLRRVENHFSIHARVQRVPQCLGGELCETLEQTVYSVLITVAVRVVRRNATLIGQGAGLQQVRTCSFYACSVVRPAGGLHFEQLDLKIGQQAVEIAAGEGQAAHGVDGDHVRCAAICRLHESNLA